MSDYTILLIDYDPRSIQHVEGLLTAAGHRVEVAKNGLAGLESFRKSKPSLVLVEAMLPKKHGFEVCQEIKQSPEGRDVPVIIITAVYRGRKYRSQAFHMYKCDEYLEKPIADDRLKEVVERFLAQAAPAAKTARSANTPAAPTESPETATPPPVGKAAEKSAEKPAAKPANATSPSREDESIAEFTEEDIMSTLDAIMPDDETAKTASG